jgi:predicted permease
VLTVVAFGLAPAIFALRLDANRTLSSESRGTTADRGHQRFRHLLIVGQFVFAMVLLASAAVFARGLHQLNDRKYGWESDRLITASIRLPAAQYPDAGGIIAFQRLALEGLEALPGVASASMSYSMPFLGSSEPRRYLAAGAPPPAPGHEPVAVTNGVTPAYFETLGTGVLSGRVFNAGDTLDAPRVFIINQAMANDLFGGTTPLGRRIAEAGGKTVEWGEIVGVVADVQSVFADRVAVRYQLYKPMAQQPRLSSEIAVRSVGVEPSTLIDSIRMTLAAVDPDLPLRQLQPAETTIGRANRYALVISNLLSFLAVLGLGLASLGIYGVISRTVTQRSSEFAIRLALGARAEDIVRLVLTSGSRLAIIGCAIGLVGALGISRLIAAGWPGMQTSSLPVLIGASLILIAIALIAGYIPARYASRLSPNAVLRAIR